MESESGCGLSIDESSPPPPASGATTPARGCSPQLPRGQCNQEELAADIATEVTIRASGDPSVSSLICRGLQAIHGAPEKEQPERAWEEEGYEVTEQQQKCSNEQAATEEGEGDSNVPALQHEPQLLSETFTTLPMQDPSSHIQLEPSYLSSLPPAAQNSNNSNSCLIPQPLSQAQTPPQPSASTVVEVVDEQAIRVSVPPMGTGGAETNKKRNKFVRPNCPIEITLEGKNLWDEFCRRGTEMIVNRSGRRMFPGFSAAVTGLKPKVKYTMKLEVVLADNHRFKFLNARWLAVGTAEPQPLSESYIHPDSPNSGAFWMRHGISFRKLKITNNKERPGNNALLHSMHKYFLRLIVEEERKTPPGEEKLPARVVLQMDFPETTFIAVTAYQNEEVTQLKITNNPFAKAFRDNAADMDWDTAQMLYSQHQGYSPLYHQYSEHFIAGNQTVAPGSWPLPSPLLPPTPLTASLPPISPLSSFTGAANRGYLTPGPSGSAATAHYPYTSTNCDGSIGPGPLSATAPGYFQWPTQPAGTAAVRHMHQPGGHIIPSSSHDIIYDHYPSTAGFICGPTAGTAGPGGGAASSNTAVAGNNLPDFDTVFTATLGPHTSHS